MKVEKQTENQLIISSKRTTKEYLFAIGIALFGIVPFTQWTNDPETYEYNLEIIVKIALFFTLCWAGLMSLGDEEDITFNKSQNNVRITRKSLLNQKTFVNGLEELEEVAIETEKSGNRIALRFEQGIAIPLTTTYFKDKSIVEKVKQQIQSFLDIQEKPQEEKGSKQKNKDKKPQVFFHDVDAEQRVRPKKKK